MEKIAVPVGATGRGTQHAQSPEAWFMHTPGLKVVVPSTPYDAKGLLKTAIRDDNPVIFFEHKHLYGSKSPGGKSKISSTKPFSTMTPAPEEGISLEVIDPRTLVPFDKEMVLNSVKKTGRLIIVTEDSRTCGIGAEISAMISEEAFDYLDFPIRRVAGLDTPIPFAPLAESYVIPDEERVVKAIKEMTIG